MRNAPHSARLAGVRTTSPAAVERQRWLAGLSLLLAVPLPLTGVVTWPVAVLFAGAAVLVGTARRVLKPVPNWVENLLAPLVVLVVVAAGGLRFGILRPVAHLAVLVAAVRLPGCARPERVKGFAALLTLIGVAGIASSTHVALAGYLAVVLATVVTGVARLELLGLGERMGAGTPVPWPPMRLVVVSVAIAFTVAAPLFAVLPRLRSPFAAGVMTGGAVSGFRETVSLNNIRSIQVSRARALHVRLEGEEEARGEWLRLVGATTQSYRGGLWAQGQRGRQRLLPDAEGRVTWSEAAASARLQVTVEKPSDRVFVPPGAVAITMADRQPFWRDPQGSLGTWRPLEPPFSYQVAFDPTRVELPPPNLGDLELPEELEVLREYAREITRGASNPMAAANLLEGHLRDDFLYSLKWPLDAPFARDPVAWFLFEGRQGHCEFFASAMVMLLRALDIPARLQTGYLGGEPDGAGGWVVRDANAHAWVVAYVGGGWRVFDPTPAVGRPAFTPAARLPTWRLTWLRLEEAWDRWVLTFSLADQLELLRRGWEEVVGSWRQLVFVALRGAALAALVVLLGAAWQRLRRSARGPRLSDVTARAVDRVRREAWRRGWVGPGSTPRQLCQEVSQRCPAVAESLAWLIGTHEEVRYRGAPPPPPAAVRRRLRATLRRLSPLSAAARGGGGWAHAPSAPPAGQRR